MRRLFALFFCSCILTISTQGTAEALRISIDPADTIHASKVSRDRNIHDILAQNIWILNEGNEPVTLKKMTISAIKADGVIVQQIIDSKSLLKRARQMAGLSQSGMMQLYDFQFRTNAKTSEGFKLMAGQSLAPKEAFLYSYSYLTALAKPEKIVIDVIANKLDGSIVKSSKTLKVVKQEIGSEKLLFPLSGSWYIGAGADIRSHHRWNVGSEFAIDIVKVGANGSTHSGGGEKNINYLAYGAGVRAAADGIVITVVDGRSEDETTLRKIGESQESHQSRISGVQAKLLVKGQDQLAGNYLIIRHRDGRYAQYAHLLANSIKVAKGDQVKRGQQIGRLGNSGNSSEPHLHFQLSAGPDMLYDRSLPITFSNVKGVFEDLDGKPLQTGDLIFAE